MIFLRYLDLVILALALPVFLVAGLPLLGWGAAAVGWLAQRAIQVVALIIFAAGLQENDAGLAAAVLVIVLFTVYFTVSLILRPFENSDQPT
jgi:hypothetical protein